MDRRQRPALGAEALRASSARVPELDGVRGVAIALVVLYHYTDVTSTSLVLEGLRRAASWGWSGVDLFFVLSGFLITGILVETRESPAYYRSFFARRCLRLFPLYFATLACVFAAMPWLSMAGAWQEAGAPALWFWLFLSNWWMGIAGVWAPGGLAVFWSLAIEEQFYLFFAPLVRALPRGGLPVALGALVVGPLLLRTGLVATGAVSPIAVHVFTVTRIDALAVGAGLAWIARRHPRALEGLALPLLMGGALATGLLFAAQGSTGWDGWAVQSLGLSTLALAWAGLVARARTGPGAGILRRSLRTRPLRALGRISYAVYVLHALVQHELRAALAARPEWVRGLLELGVAPWAVLILASLALTLVLAAASWHGLERHALAWKSRFAP